eukprot:evm.model.scf_218.3 EVM.evm.TU.scf_218.3   scf_218:20646-21201(-)
MKPALLISLVTLLAVAHAYVQPSLLSPDMGLNNAIVAAAAGAGGLICYFQVGCTLMFDGRVSFLSSSPPKFVVPTGGTASFHTSFFRKLALLYAGSTICAAQYLPNCEWEI